MLNYIIDNKQYLSYLTLKVKSLTDVQQNSN